MQPGGLFQGGHPPRNASSSSPAACGLVVLYARALRYCSVMAKGIFEVQLAVGWLSTSKPQSKGEIICGVHGARGGSGHESQRGAAGGGGAGGAG